MVPLNYIGEELYVHNYDFTLNGSDSEPYSIEVQLANQNDICVLNDTLLKKGNLIGILYKNCTFMLLLYYCIF